VPGHYLDGAAFRPAHIHLKVAALGGDLTTQLYFEGDPYNESDRLIIDSLIMPTREMAGEIEGVMDLIVDATAL